MPIRSPLEYETDTETGGRRPLREPTPGRLIDTLRALPLFDGVDPAVVERLAAASRIHTASHRAPIVDRGDPVTRVLVVLDGMFEITIVTEDGDGATLGFMGPGSLVGDAAVLEDGPYGVSVAAGPACVYLAIDAATFLRAMRDNAALAFNVARALAQRLRLMFCRDEWTTTRSVPRRLALFLVWMYQQQETGPVLRVTQEQLGNLIGVSRETVNKHLRRWAQTGWIEQRGGAITLLAPRALLSEDIALE